MQEKQKELEFKAAFVVTRAVRVSIARLVTRKLRQERLRLPLHWNALSNMLHDIEISMYSFKYKNRAFTHYSWADIYKSHSVVNDRDAMLKREEEQYLEELPPTEVLQQQETVATTSLDDIDGGMMDLLLDEDAIALDTANIDATIARLQDMDELELKDVMFDIGENNLDCSSTDDLRNKLKTRLTALKTTYLADKLGDIKSIATQRQQRQRQLLNQSKDSTKRMTEIHITQDVLRWIKRQQGN